MATTLLYCAIHTTCSSGSVTVEAQRKALLLLLLSTRDQRGGREENIPECINNCYNANPHCPCPCSLSFVHSILARHPPMFVVHMSLAHVIRNKILISLNKTTNGRERDIVSFITCSPLTCPHIFTLQLPFWCPVNHRLLSRSNTQ